MEYSIPIIYQCSERFDVEADSLQEAVEKALKEFFSIPDDKYLDDSFEIDSIVYDDYPDEELDMDKAINNT